MEQQRNETGVRILRMPELLQTDGGAEQPRSAPECIHKARSMPKTVS